MSDTKVVEEMSKDNAILLLAAAEELGLDADVVRTSEDGFVAPVEVIEAAGLEAVEEDEPEEGLSFATKGEAEQFADDNELDVDKKLHADEYKEAVLKAANEKGLS